mmetsp:Transcript_31265/g.70234  ORF Transcript_31265/g.70234 Transcript_31265/m.70234 type:complete len:212 (-) Transcript_31265:376-1011(-)
MSEKSSGFARRSLKPGVLKSISFTHSSPPGSRIRWASMKISLLASGVSSWAIKSMFTKAALPGSRRVTAASRCEKATRASAVSGSTQATSCSTSLAAARPCRNLATATKCGERSRPRKVTPGPGMREARRRVDVPVPQPRSTTKLPGLLGTRQPSDSRAASNADRNASSPAFPGPFPGKLRWPTALPASSCSQAASQQRFPPCKYAWKGAR